METCSSQCSMSAGPRLAYYIIETRKALQQLDTVPALLEDLIIDLHSLEHLTSIAKSTSNTYHTQLCNYIYGFRKLQRQLQYALAVGLINDTS